VTKALEKARATPNEHYMKVKGVVQDECREMLRDLQTLNVPVEKLNEVVHIVGRGFGLEIKDNVSICTIGRVMREGGVASEMQIVHEIDTAKGVIIDSILLKIVFRPMCRIHGQWGWNHNKTLKL
jgi:hypothetical protein